MLFIQRWIVTEEIALFVLRFETIAALTELQIASENGVIIPSNIEEGDRRFIQAAASNDDFCEDSKDGKKTTHANTMVLYQSKLSGTFADENYSRPMSKTRKQTIKEIDYKDLLKVQFIKLSKGVSLSDYNQKEAQNMLVGRDFTAKTPALIKAFAEDISWILPD